MVRVLHVSDTHLGHQAYTQLSPDGLNQREVDFHEAFRRVVDHALATTPDLVVHAGDLFDVVRPSNRSIGFALHEVRRLSAAGIPFVVVSGNHEAPRLRETGSIFRIFEGLPNVHPVYRGDYEALRIETRSGPTTIHAVPQALRQSDFTKALAASAPQGSGAHVLLVHGTVAGVDGLFMGEMNELTIPEAAMRPEYDYIALGHFHNHRRIGANAAYAGSTERTSFSEANEEKVALEVDVGAGAPRIRPVPTGARPMRDGGVLDVGERGRDAIQDEAAQRLAALDGPGAIVRLIVRGIDPAILRSLDARLIRRAAPEALHLDLRLETRGRDEAQQAPAEFASLDEEWERFLANRPLSGVPREAVRRRAAELLTGAGHADP